MQRILSKESVRKALYAKSDNNLGSPADNHYRNQVDDYLEHWLFDEILDVVYDIQKDNIEHQIKLQTENLYHQYHATQN